MRPRCLYARATTCYFWSLISLGSFYCENFCSTRQNSQFEFIHFPFKSIGHSNNPFAPFVSWSKIQSCLQSLPAATNFEFILFSPFYVCQMQNYFSMPNRIKSAYTHTHWLAECCKKYGAARNKHHDCSIGHDMRSFTKLHCSFFFLPFLFLRPMKERVARNK